MGESLVWKMPWSQAALSTQGQPLGASDSPCQKSGQFYLLLWVMVITELLLCTKYALNHLLHVLSHLILTKPPGCIRDNFPRMTEGNRGNEFKRRVDSHCASTWESRDSNPRNVVQSVSLNTPLPGRIVELQL